MRNANTSTTYIKYLRKHNKITAISNIFHHLTSDHSIEWNLHKFNFFIYTKYVQKNLQEILHRDVTLDLNKNVETHMSLPNNVKLR